MFADPLNPPLLRQAEDHTLYRVSGTDPLPEKRLNTIPYIPVYGLRMPIYGSNLPPVKYILYFFLRCDHFVDIQKLKKARYA